ncbi:helix-turn-helix domain-containing protein [Nocardiopsis synnemataformans]|uniref:helix-turn-helix domain-containing protein n=1 Tax=Nocardiopsis synnemataformans TaxID=61305 RepID=UPI003EB76A1F
MTEDFSPTARRRRLSAELAGLRERHRQPDGRKTTSADVADALDWQRSKLSRIETNQWKRPSRRDVSDLLNYYGVTDETYRDYLLDLVKEGRSRAWWTDVEDLYGSTNYIGLEAVARRARSWGVIVPGLFQTRDYAAAVVMGGGIRDLTEVDRRVDTRMTRQLILERPEPPQVWAVVDEAAIRKPVGGREVQRGQVQHLLDLTQAEHLTLQVMRDATGAHPGMGSSFSILDFESGDRPVVHLETLTESLLLEDPKKTDRYDLMFSHVSAAAASPVETADYLHEVLHDL